MTIGLLVICGRDEPFIDLTLQSAVGIADEAVVVGDPNEETRKRIFDSGFKNAKLVWRPWDGDFGAARNAALEELHTGYVLSLDADEVLSDDGYLLRDYANREDACCYDLEYVHFIWHFGLVDSTQPRHRGLRRFYPAAGALYSPGVHEIADSKEWQKFAFPERPKIFHLGYVKGIAQIPEKYKMNVERSKVHSKEFLDQWKAWHLTGSYPVRSYTEREYPWPVKERFSL